MARAICEVRCFVAVWPVTEIKAALASLPRPDLPGLHWSGPEQWHVTLRFFGELDYAQVSMAETLLTEALSALEGPLKANGGPHCRLLGPGLVVWPVEGLETLAAAVQGATGALGQAPPDRPFVGHVTLARARKGVDLRRQRLPLPSLEARWPVRSVCLVESHLHPRGARYRDLVELSLPTAAG